MVAKQNVSASRKALLVKLEKMVGSECYNANIQNWGPGGAFEGEGREFRYPIMFRGTDGKKMKLWNVDHRSLGDNILGGYYAFGANELHVMQALDKILTYLEENHATTV